LTPRVLFLVPADYEALRRKGVERMILERDEHGFFERVITVHPIAYHDQDVELTPVHRMVEFSLGRSLSANASPLKRLSAPLRALQVLFAVLRLARNERVDLIRATDPYLMGLFAWIVARVLRRPFCVSIHADYQKNFELTPKIGWSALLRRMSTWCPGFVLKRADLVLPIRLHLARWAESRGASPSRIRVIPHGIDLARFAGAAEGRSSDAWSNVSEQHIVSFAGRLSRYNYVHDVLDVAERVLAGRRALFVLAGDGEERAALQQRIASSPLLSAGVRLLGARPYEDVVSLRQHSAVSLCLMGGYSVLEACAAGSAVIAYDVDWHREIIVDGKSGLLVPEGDIDALEAGVLRLLDNPQLAHQLGKEAQAFVEQHHDERKTSEIKRDCYQHLLTSRRAA
jgi:glycogen(starch) synthase